MSNTKIHVEREQLEIERPLLADLVAFCERRIYLDTVAHERLLLADFGQWRPAEIDPKLPFTKGINRPKAVIREPQFSTQNRLSGPSIKLNFNRKLRFE